MGNSSEMLEFKSNMMKMFEMTDLGQPRYFLGLEVTQNENALFVSQRKYAEDLLKTANMLHCNSISTPLNSNEKLHLQDSSGNANPTRYKMLVGRLLYLTHTRLDIMHVVGIVSRYMQAPSNHHYGAMKRILRYISGTVGYGIQYDSNVNLKLMGYWDSDWGGLPDDRRSTARWVFMVGSKKQQITALSSTEVEYISITSAAYKAVWLRKLLENLCEKQEDSSVILCDNKSAISIAKNPILHGRTKHIDTRYHFIRDLVQNGSISITLQYT